MEIPAQPSAIQRSSTSENYTVPLIIITSLFFMWGFLTVMNDVLIPHLKGIFELTYFKAMMVQFAFFAAYGIVSYPAGHLVKRVGYKQGAVYGLVIAGIGCAIFYPAASLQVYSLFLIALFILASGITILQVSANPYVTLLGPPETAARRLTLTQAFNSFGTTIGPVIGSALILTAAVSTNTSGLSSEELAMQRTAAAESVQIPYLVLAGSLIALAVAFAFIKHLPVIVDKDSTSEGEHKSAWQYRHLVLGAIAIFAYVGGEVTIGSFLVNFFGEPNIGGLAEHTAGKLVAYYWGGAMIGRFVGVAIMSYVKPAHLLVINTIIVVALLLVAIFSDGNIAMWSVLSIGLFNSIMFPTIFSLSVAKLGPATSQASGILCTAIVGGAFIPLLQGLLADKIGIQLSFFLPIICYLYIIFFAVKGYKPADN